MRVRGRIPEGVEVDRERLSSELKKALKHGGEPADRWHMDNAADVPPLDADDDEPGDPLGLYLDLLKGAALPHDLPARAVLSKGLGTARRALPPELQRMDDDRLKEWYRLQADTDFQRVFAEAFCRALAPDEAPSVHKAVAAELASR